MQRKHLLLPGDLLSERKVLFLKIAQIFRELLDPRV